MNALRHPDRWMASEMHDIEAALGDRFRLEEEIGSGGWADVYRAEDLRHKRQVAIKVLRSEVALRHGIARFEREIEIVGKLSHPHILPLLDSTLADGFACYVMPFVEGESLRARLMREGPLPIDEAIRLGVEIADGLAYAHSRGVVHRDIKPGNIMLESGHAVVCDFGVAAFRSAQGHQTLTETGQAVGTLSYMSPEQITGESEVDERADLYALGCLLYEMLAGERAFDAPSSQGIVGLKMLGDLKRLSALRSTVPEGLEALIERLVERDAADRPRTATEVKEALRDIERGGRPLASLRSRPGAGKRGLARTVSLAIGGALVVFTVVAAIGFLSSAAFDYKLQIPDAFRPTRGDVLVVGLQALVPVMFFTLVTLAAFTIAKWFLRRAREAVTKVPGIGPKTEAFDQRVTQQWRGFQSGARPGVAVEAFVILMVAASALVVTRFWGLLSSLWWVTDTEALACAARPLHRVFTVWMAPLIVGLFAGWLNVFRWARLRGASSRRIALARWTSLAWIGALLLVVTIPWRVLWDAEGQRVRIDGERAYVLREAPDELLVYNPERRMAERHDLRAAAQIEYLSAVGYLFEEPELFEADLVDECRMGAE